MSPDSFPIVLVLILLFYGVGVESAICTHPSMKDDTRRAFLSSHNKYSRTGHRSTVAKGKGYNGNIGYTPPAANMLKMTYDCTMEAGTIAYAQTCCHKESKPNTRPGIGENVIEISKMYLTMPQVARQATEMWYRELTKYGVNANMFSAATSSTIQSILLDNHAAFAQKVQSAKNEHHYVYEESDCQ